MSAGVSGRSESKGTIQIGGDVPRSLLWSPQACAQASPGPERARGTHGELQEEKTLALRETGKVPGLFLSLFSVLSDPRPQAMWGWQQHIGSLATENYRSQHSEGREASSPLSGAMGQTLLLFLPLCPPTAVVQSWLEDRKGEPHSPRTR